MTVAPILEIRKLTKRFGGVTAVDGVDFTLADGELRCLIGPNGAGKSTFFNCLSGQLAPTSGAVHLDGHDISGWPSHAIARLGVGIKTQVPSVFDGLEVRENVWLAARRRYNAREAKERCDELLTRLNIQSLAAHMVGELAHGQRQLVEIGMVIASDPRLILLDEPAAGMSRDEVARLAALISEIARERSLIVVDHDMRFIRMIAETVTVFHQGRVLIEGEVDKVLADAMVKDVYLGKQVV